MTDEPITHQQRELDQEQAVADLDQSIAYREQALSWIYFSGTLDAAIWGCELAQGEGRERIYIVEPTGEFFDDPNLTDKKFPGNPTRSYRSTEPLRIVGEVTDWTRLTPAALQAWRDRLAAILGHERGHIIN